MYYCDMGPDGAEIRIMLKMEKVGQYVIVNSDYIPDQLSYRAHTIVSYDPDGRMKWYKHRNRSDSAQLTKDEQDGMMLQILKSETW